MNLPPLSSHAAKSVAAVEAENFIHPTTLKTDALHELIRPEVIEPDFTASTSAWILRGGLIALLKDLLLQVTLGRYSIFTATRFEHVHFRIGICDIHSDQRQVLQRSSRYRHGPSLLR